MYDSLKPIRILLEHRLSSMKSEAKARKRFTLYQQVEEIEKLLVMFEREIRSEQDVDGRTAHSGDVPK